MKKRIAPILMSLMMIIGMIPVSAGVVFSESDADSTKPVIDSDSISVTLPEGVSVTYTAKPAEGYTFKGWYEGEFGESSFIETPSEKLLSNQNPYTPDSVDDAKAICAVFECTGHKWVQVVTKATPDKEGAVQVLCDICDQ